MGRPADIPLRKEDAIRTEVGEIRRDGRLVQRHTLWVFECLGCGVELRKHASAFNKQNATARCRKCSARFRSGRVPFETAYLNLKKRCEQETGLRRFTLTFSEFLELTETRHCTYCGNVIRWREYGSVQYNLDRKDNRLGYTAENVVVCCWPCNAAKGSRYTFREFRLLTHLMSVWRDTPPVYRDWLERQVLCLTVEDAMGDFLADFDPSFSP